MNGPWMNDAAMDNKYQYNGKEINDDFGLGWNDYGARWYDPVIGRFPGIDPLCDTFNYVTPYNYAENTPVGFIDLWGLQKYKPKMGGNFLRNAYEGMKTIAIELASTLSRILPQEGTSSAEDYSHPGTCIELLSDIKIPGNGRLSIPTADGGSDNVIGTGDLVIPAGVGSGGFEKLPLGGLGKSLDVLKEGIEKSKDAESVSGYVVDKNLSSKIESAKVGVDTVHDLNGNAYRVEKLPIDKNGNQKTTITPINKAE